MQRLTIDKGIGTCVKLCQLMEQVNQANEVIKFYRQAL